MEYVKQYERLVVMDDLVEEVCWHLLAKGQVARIGFVVDGEPWILPVNYALTGHTVVFRTDRGSMLHSLGDGASVVVELDHVDATAQTGWSVLVRGTARELTKDAMPAVETAVHPWAPGDKDRWLSITSEAITGRAISRPIAAPQFRLPYMPPG